MQTRPNSARLGKLTLDAATVRRRAGKDIIAMTRLLIAVVDDDPSVLKSLARLLRWAGYDVGAFASAEDFLASMATSLPQCLVLDVQMPEMSGIEA